MMLVLHSPAVSMFSLFRHPTAETIAHPGFVMGSTYRRSSSSRPGLPRCQTQRGDSNSQGQPDRRVQLMAERGRMGWQSATSYGRRIQAEMAMARYKHLIGPKLRARSLPAQKSEVASAIAVLNTMIRTAKPVSVGVA